VTEKTFEKLWDDFSLLTSGMTTVRVRIKEELARNFAKYRTESEQTRSLFVCYCAGWEAGLRETKQGNGGRAKA